MYLNNSLLIASLVANGVKGISRKITQNVLDSYCSQELKQQCTSIQLPVYPKRRLDDSKDLTITNCHRECIFQDCKLYGKTKLHEKIASQNKETIDWEKSVTWHQWKTVKSEKNEKKKFDKVLYMGQLSSLLAVFCLSVDKLSTHLFHFQWQAMQFEECKKQLQKGDILMVMDFAQNWAHKRQDEIQGAYWSRSQTTLHPIIIYYPCPEDFHHLVCDEVIVISDDLVHDSFAVKAFMDRALEHLKEKNVPVE